MYAFSMQPPFGDTSNVVPESTKGTTVHTYVRICSYARTVRMISIRAHFILSIAADEFGDFQASVFCPPPASTQPTAPVAAAAAAAAAVTCSSSSSPDVLLPTCSTPELKPLAKESSVKDKNTSPSSARVSKSASPGRSRLTNKKPTLRSSTIDDTYELFLSTQRTKALDSSSTSSIDNNNKAGSKEVEVDSSSETTSNNDASEKVSAPIDNASVTSSEVSSVPAADTKERIIPAPSEIPSGSSQEQWADFSNFEFIASSEVGSAQNATDPQGSRDAFKGAQPSSSGLSIDDWQKVIVAELVPTPPAAQNAKRDLPSASESHLSSGAGVAGKKDDFGDFEIYSAPSLVEPVLEESKVRCCTF